MIPCNLKNEKGAAAVEFAIVLPVLALLLFGIMDFALLFYNKQVITNASREGARALIAEYDPDGTDTVPEMRSFVRPIVDSYCTKNDGTGNSILINLGGTNTLDINNVEPEKSGEYITVTVSYDYNHLFGLLTGFGQTTITAETVMRVE
jgi:Flp pilus assembly protein TadG